MRQFPTVPQPELNDRAAPWPRGHGVGGSSAVNGLIFIRGHRDDYDAWSRLGAPGWDYENVLPHFKSIECAKDHPGTGRGESGELAVSKLRYDNPTCHAWLEAAREAGLPRNDHFNSGETLGVGPFELSIGKRWRASASRAFIHPVRTRRNLDIRTGATVSRILIEKGRAVGVEWVEQGRVRSARVGREVALSSGAIRSPQILQLSGVGPADLLRTHGIELKHDLPAVGENLQDHLQVRSISRLRNAHSLNIDTRNPLKLAQMGLQWAVQGRGPLTIGAIQVGGAWYSGTASDGPPDLQLYAMPLSIEKAGEPLHDFPGFTAGVWQCHPKSRGSIAIASADPFAAPRIDPNYLSEGDDRRALYDGLNLLREIQSRPAFARICDAEVTPGAALKSKSELDAYISATASTIYHCCGTCRMGEDSGAVVDSRLRVRGVEGLRVIDASVMPQIPSANTNAAAMMIGEKGAAMMLSSEDG